MPTTDETQLQTVPVIVTNFPATKTTEDINVRLNKLYDLFNGKEYKKRFEDIEKEIKAVQNSNALIHTLLRTYLPTLSANLGTISNNTKPKLSSTPTLQTQQGSINETTQPTPPSHNNQQNNDDIKESIEESLGTIASDLRSSIEELRGVLAELVQGINDRPVLDVQNTTSNSTSDNISNNTNYNDKNIRNSGFGGKDATTEAHENAENQFDSLKNNSGGIGSQHEATGEAEQNAKSIIESFSKQQEATNKAVQNAKKILDLQKKLEEDLEDERRRTRDNIISVLQGIWDTIKQSFRKVFESWDRQAAHLKEIGMGRENIIELNNITSDTMHATEDLVDWNISIDKAIQTTNDMVSAGFSPKYMRENNKNLIMGLESAGLQLQPSTIRELGNAVVDATHVKELTQGWADLIAADTENRVDAQELSRYLASDEYKKYVSLAMSQGYTRAQADEQMQKSMLNAMRMGASGKEVFNLGMVEAQANLGGGAYLNIPESLTTMVGAMQSVGTFSGDLKKITQDFGNTVKKLQVSPDALGTFKNVNLGAMASNDSTIYDNFLTNRIVNTKGSGPLHVATHEEQEAGRDESLLTRATKKIANDLLGDIPIIGSHSIGANSQFLTGDASFGTNFLGSLWDKFVPSLQDRFNKSDKKETYLKEIAENTDPSQQVANDLLVGLIGGAGASGGALGKMLPAAMGALPAILGVTAAVGIVATEITTVISGLDRIEKAQQDQIEAERNARDSYAKEQDLREQYEKAIRSGDTDTAKVLAEQLRQLRADTDKEFLKQIEAEDEETTGKVQMGMWAIPMFGTLLGLADTISGHAISEKTSQWWNGDKEERIAEKRETLDREVGAYAEGGVITKEQLALVGEGNRPEVILPLTKPDRITSLLEQIGVIPNNKNVNEGSTYTNDVSIVDVIKKQQSDVEKILLLLQRNENSKLKGDGDTSFIGSLSTSTPATSMFYNLIKNMVSGRNISFFEDGGVVDSEQAAIVGEGNKPEVVLPLTNPVRTIALLKEAANHPGTSKIIRDIFNIKTNTPFAEIDFSNIPLTQNSLDTISITHPELVPFISYLESSLDRLHNLSYREQLSDLKNNNIITQQEYNRVVEQNQNKLIDSLDSLNKTVQESNRMSRNSQLTPNLSSNINRRYI